MWLKIVGGLMVMSAGTCLGFAQARLYVDRSRQISQLIGCLTALASCVNYIGLPLPAALLRCGEQVDGPVREFFQHTAQFLEAHGWWAPSQAIKAALSQASGLAFHVPERELLLQLGSNLGSTDREEQLKYLALVIQELGRIEQESLRARDQNVKMCRYLGICGGLALVILLV